jgi:hypothetical protein
MTRVEILNDIYSAIADLRVAKALLNDRVRGTNDPLFDTVTGMGWTIRNAEKAYAILRTKEFAS